MAGVAGRRLSTALASRWEGAVLLHRGWTLDERGGDDRRHLQSGRSTDAVPSAHLWWRGGVDQSLLGRVRRRPAVSDQHGESKRPVLDADGRVELAEYVADRQPLGSSGEASYWVL